VRPDLGAVREELARLARNRKTRKVVFTKQTPCDWQPTSVVNPKLGGYFSEPGAWEYIAELLEGGHEIQQVVLTNPPGECAYVMNVDLGTDQPRLYIKLQLKAGNIFCRSFHYSYQ